jgi:SAM-dependent methyltransferase
LDDSIRYSRWAHQYDALHAFKDYAAEAARVVAVVDRHHPGARGLLDIACGSGRHLEHLRARFEVEGLDANETFLAMTRERCPGVTTHLARMEHFALGRRYDVVICMFSSIGFVRTLDGLRSACAAFAAHLAPGGLVLIEPWFAPATFWPGKVNAHFVDEPGRKLAWIYTTELVDGESVLRNEFLFGTPEGIERASDTQVLGLFTADEYVAALRSAGLEPVESIPLGNPEWKRGLHVARKP